MEENLNNSLKQKILAKKQLQNTQAPELSKDRVCILEILQKQVDILLNRVADLEETSNKTIESMRTKLEDIDSVIIENSLDIENLKDKTIAKSASIDLRKTESKLNRKYRKYKHILLGVILGIIIGALVINFF